MSTREDFHWTDEKKDRGSFKKEKREYPLREHECYPKEVEAMFDAKKLKEAFEYFVDKTLFAKNDKRYNTEAFFEYLYRLEKDIPFKDQRHQP